MIPHLSKGILLLAMLWLPIDALGQRKEIIGYYPSWKWKSRDKVMTPANIPYEKLTIINYAFFYPLSSGELVGRDIVGDEIALKGERDPQTGAYKAGSSMVDLAHRHGVKVLLSVGGWEDSNNFPEVAASQTTRAAFAHSCLEIAKLYDFDGMDIDWEYPGYAEHKGTRDDKHNFTTLLQITRDSLNAYAKQVGKRMLLTAALPAGVSLLANYDFDKVTGILDMLNIMTYDFSGIWDPVSAHNAPLYSPNETDTLRNVDATFSYYTRTLSVPPSKINLGIPFYGHTFANCTALYGTHAGADTAYFTSEGSSFNEITKLKSKFSRIWDSRAKVPYLVNQSWKVIVSYDDEESVGYKAQYVVDQKVGGVIIWEITGDFLEDGTTPLLDVIVSKFKNDN